MKILILANHIMGLKRFRGELIERLVSRGDSVVISVPVEDSEIEFGDCTVIDTPIDRRGTNPIQDLSLIFKYFSIINKIKPDIVLTYTVKPNLYGGLACRVLRIPYMPNITGLSGAILTGGVSANIIKFLERLVYRRAKMVFCQNQYIVHYLKEQGSISDNWLLIPGSGVNLNKFIPLKYPDPSKPVVFNFIARVMKEKGIEEYLEAAKFLKREYPDVIFRIIGMLEDKHYEKRLDECRDFIEYNGLQSDIIPFLDTSHCTVNPSYSEGMSNVLLEAAASTRPVIASDIPGCYEIVEHGITGFLCPVKSSEALTQAMETFIKIPYEQKKQMGLAGRAKVEKEFNKELIIGAYLEQIDNLN